MEQKINLSLVRTPFWGCPLPSAKLVPLRRGSPVPPHRVLGWQLRSHPASPGVQVSSSMAVLMLATSWPCRVCPPSRCSKLREAMPHWSRGLPQPEECHQGEIWERCHQCGDLRGFAPNILENKEGLELLKTAIGKPGLHCKGGHGMDVAASEFFRSGNYDLDFKSPDDPSRYISPDQLADLYKSFIKDYPVVSIEDPFDQDDWGASEVHSQCRNPGSGGMTHSDQPKEDRQGVNEKSCNCLLLKVNQIGSVTESLQACKLAQANGWGVMVSHRSGETEDTFIADLVVGLCTGADQDWCPLPITRLAKYNQLLRIEEELGSKAKFAGRNFRNPLAK
nr:c-myc binding protein [Homo sapiens]